MRYAVVLTAAMLLRADAAFAQTRLPKEISKPADLPATGAPKAPSTNPCSAYGPRFVRIAGTETCAKVGGGISVETSSGARGR